MDTSIPAFQCMWMLIVLLGFLHLPALWQREWFKRKDVLSISAFLCTAILLCALIVAFSLVGSMMA